MFSFMKKDKDKEKEKEKKELKEKKKKEKEEAKLEKRDSKREKKERQNITPEEMSRLEEMKRSVFHRLSDRDKRKSHKHQHGDEHSVGKSDSSESFLSATSGSSSGSALSSPSKDVHSTSSQSSNPHLHGEMGPPPEKKKPQPLPKPRGILKSQPGAQSSGSNLDDSKILQENTRRNEEMMDMIQESRASQQHAELPPPPNPNQILEPVEQNVQVEKDFGLKNLPLPPLVPSKPPRIRQVTVKRNPSGGFGFSLRRGTLRNHDGTDRSVVFAEPGLSAMVYQTSLLPGDRLVEIDGKNVEDWSREEVSVFHLILHIS
jgi:myosin-18